MRVCKPPSYLVLPLLTAGLLAYLWFLNDQPLLKQPIYLIISVIILIIYQFYPRRRLALPWQLATVSFSWHWGASLKRQLWLVGRGALPAALLALGCSLSGFTVREERLRHDLDLAIVYDYSASMDIPDYVGQKRSQAAREVIRQLLENEEIGQVAIVGFAAQSFLIAPLSSDFELLADILERPMPAQNDSTAIGDALIVALAHLAKGQAAEKQILIISDGLNNSGLVSLQEAVSVANTLHIPINCVLIGQDAHSALGYLSTATNGQFWTVPDGAVIGSELVSGIPLKPREHAPRPLDFSSGLALILLILALLNQYGFYGAHYE